MKDLTVDVSSLRFDLKSISESRILSQFSNKKIFNLLLGVFTSEIQELSDAIADLIEYRTLQKARGYQLDALGRIAGISRQGFNYDSKYWFTPNEEETKPDEGHWWSNPAEQAVTEEMDDNTYRERIWLRILENHNKYSSVPEIKEQILEGLNENIGIVNEGNVTGKIYVSQSIGLTNYNLLDYNTNTQQVDNDFLFAYPIATVISEVIRR